LSYHVVGKVHSSKAGVSPADGSIARPPPHGSDVGWLHGANWFDGTLPAVTMDFPDPLEPAGRLDRPMEST
jgi:hypothetical protein